LGEKRGWAVVVVAPPPDLSEEEVAVLGRRVGVVIK
jgi:hypothetical protein